MSDDEEIELRRRIVRDSVQRLADGLPQTTILGIPFAELESLQELARETADDLGVEIEMEDRIGDLGLVHLELWRADVERSGVVGDAAPPRR